MTLIEIFVYIGIVASGISGTLIGIRKHMDLFGVLFLCALTSLGGGMLRDIMIGNLPPSAFTQPSYFYVSISAGFLTWIFYHKVSRLKNIINFTDAIGLGVFTAVGANTAFTHNYHQAFLVISMGVITGIGGGVLRDIFAKEIPYVFRKEVYAVASILGAVVFYFTYDRVPHVLSLYVCLGVTFLIRVLSVIFNLNAPVLKPKIRSLPR